MFQNDLRKSREGKANAENTPGECGGDVESDAESTDGWVQGPATEVFKRYSGEIILDCTFRNAIFFQDRSKNVDNYLITTDPLIDVPNWAELDVSPSTELSMAQLQQFMNNDREVREREKEVMAVNTSIRELNTLFQDLSQMIVDQGSIVDRWESVKTIE